MRNIQLGSSRVLSANVSVGRQRSRTRFVYPDVWRLLLPQLYLGAKRWGSLDVGGIDIAT